MQVALEDAGKVLKKQKTCSSKSDESLDVLIGWITQLQKDLESGKAESRGAALDELKKRLKERDIVQELNSYTKDLHSGINRLGKALDKAFDGHPDICKTLRSVEMDADTLNQVVAEHFYREGRFDLGDMLTEEAGSTSSEVLKAPYLSLHDVLEQLRAHNLAPALEWVDRNREQLSKDEKASSFEFKLHSLNFIQHLKEKGQQAALAYARANFPRFQHHHLKEIQRLMACLLFSHRPPDSTPYADLLSGTPWHEVARDFSRHACSLLGLARESPLTVTVAAGTVALPHLLKLVSVMENTNQVDLKAADQLPIELELGPEFVFHSIFACPVSREQSTADNPPMLLPCNHVLCEHSVLKIAKSRSKVFKCPYCPMEASTNNLRKLIFPDVQ